MNHQANNPREARTPKPEASLAYLYDGSLEGILCVIFDSYKRHETVSDVYTLANAQPRIGQVFHEVKTELETALRVRKRIIQVCGYDAYCAIRAASLSEDPNKGSYCLSFARFALNKNRARWKDPNAKRLDATKAIANPETRPMLELERFVMNERHYMQQFLRFEELEGEVWFASCHPKASVVPLLMDYFVARFNTQSFIIYDARHHLAGVYEGTWGKTKNKPFGCLMGSAMELPDKNLKTTQQQESPKGKYCTNPEAAALPASTNQFNAAKPLSNRRNKKKSTCPWYLVQSDSLSLPKRTQNEEAMRQAWKRFYKTVSIEDRYNPELRRNFMPMRFWDDLTEMQID